MLPTEALLEISSTWPEMTLTPGALLFEEGGDDGRLAVLVEGSLSVRRGDEEFATIGDPGACIGEISLLLDRTHGATVVSIDDSRVRVLDDARSRLATDAALLGPVASILASRLQLVNGYLADLRLQYADSGHGLGMVSTVLGSLSAHSGVPVDPGSEREPDAPY
jgi:CRP/FNR family transcriptional regulator, cyclic AMP receptor protein